MPKQMEADGDKKLDQWGETTEEDVEKNPEQVEETPKKKKQLKARSLISWEKQQKKREENSRTSRRNAEANGSRWRQGA